MISDALRRRAVELGVEVTYDDVDQVTHDADEAVVSRVVEVLDDDQGQHPGGVVAPIHLDPTRPVMVSGKPTDAELLVNGTRVEVEFGANRLDLPGGLPVGCHPLRVEADGHITESLVVVPPAAMPGFDPSERSSCLFAPAYALWEHDEPLPSFAHVARLARRATDFGVDMIATLPLYAAFLDEPFDPSPYSPISRLHWNEVYLSDVGLPQAPVPDLGGEVAWRELGERRRGQLMRAALDADDQLIGELDRFIAAHPDVGSFARFMASRESGGDLVVERSHVLAQFLADRELRRIGRDGAASLSLDLPIGSHPEGWETWAHPQLFAPSMSVGAPPDTFFTDGQNWGFSPQLPAAMRQTGYELWRQMIARAGRYCDLLRIDHVMAVHRLWWVPDGQPADRGVYVRYPHDELLAVIAAEAASAGVGIVGENLGTVPPEVDDALNAWNVLGMHEEQFLLDGPELADIPARSVAGVRTHDMAPFATVAGDPAAAENLSAYRRLLGSDREPDRPLLDAILERLASSDAQIVVADLDDLIDETRPHNLPGRVVDGIWRRRLDRPTTETLADERVERRLDLLVSHRTNERLGVTPDFIQPPSAAVSDRLGATPNDGSTRFEVWAPDASSVEVVVERSGGDTIVASLDAAEPDDGPTSARATWSAVVDGVGAGDRYRFRLDGGDLLADPASRLQPDGVHGPSEVVDVAAFDWTDASWTGVALADTVLYELHIGTFTADGTFDAAIGELDRLVDLGVTTIELMPVSAFPGTRNWGYDGVFPFAAQASYGGPTGLALLVDAAHSKGLAVVLDVVYNHFGPEGNVLPHFGPYLTDDYSTPWGGAVNVSGRHSDSVRRYLIDNAVGWITDYHLDGLRLDAVHAIVDPTARPFVAELTAAVHRAADDAGRTVLVTIESSSNDARIVTDVAANGWGCDAVWNDDIHHALRVALTGERHEYYAGYSGVNDLARAWRHRWVYRGQHSSTFGRRHGSDADGIDHRRFIAFARNHDHNGNTPLGHRLLHDGGPSDPRRRLAAAATLLSPFTPMLFMGEEYAEQAPFPYFIDHSDPDLVRAVQDGRRQEFSGADWGGGVADPAAESTFLDAVLDPSVADEPGAHRDMLDLYRVLLALRRDHRVLTHPDADHDVEVVGDVMVVTRRLDGIESVLTMNFGEDVREDAWNATLVFDSSASGEDGVPPWSARLRISAPTPA